MEKKVAFIGLGVMGYPMAGHLYKSGYEVSVYNRTPQKAENWVAEFGGEMALTPRAVVEDADFVMTCVGNDLDLYEVTLGEDGCYGSLKNGAIHIDHTTASAEMARKLAKNARGFDVLDAPVSGGQSGAEAGALAIMCGGDVEVYHRASPVLASYGKKVALIGPHGAGQQCKMVNQIAIAGLVQALAEAMNFSKRAGLDGAKVLEVITSGAAGSWQMSNRGSTMLEGRFDFGFAVDWMRKDLGIVQAEAKRIGAEIPVTDLVDSFYQEVQQMGGGKWDTSSLMARLSEMK